MQSSETAEMEKTELLDAGSKVSTEEIITCQEKILFLKEK